MPLRKTNGFTLVELLVVISIIGILAAALTAQFTKARSMGQSMRCKANLRNLAQAALSYGVETEHLPWAGTHEVKWPETEGSKYKVYYRRRTGWVHWAKAGVDKSTSMQGGGMDTACFWGSSKTDVNPYSSITNGTLWSYVGKDLAAYVCDVHRSAALHGKPQVLRSYAMNGFFNYANFGKNVVSEDDRWISLDSVTTRGNAGNLLLFAELPAYGGTHDAKAIKWDANASDGVLETDIRKSADITSTSYYTKQSSEVLGFNHQVAKRYVAHVAFADGHVDVLIEPKGSADADLKELAKQLCNGDELSQALREKMR